MGALILVALAVLASPLTAQDEAARTRARAAFDSGLDRLARDPDVAAARAAFREAVALDPTYPEPRFNLGVLAEGDEDWPEAARWLEEYLRLAPGSKHGPRARLLLDRVRAAQEQDRTPEGRKHRQYDEAVSGARALLGIGRTGDAVTLAQVAARLDDARHEAYCVAALALLRDGATATAATFLEQALQRAPEAQRAAIHASLEEVRRALEVSALEEAGGAALRKGDHRVAHRLLTRAWSLAPGRDDLGLAAAAALGLAEDWGACAKLLRTLRGSTDLAIGEQARARLARVESLVRPVDLGALLATLPGHGCVVVAVRGYGPAAGRLRAGDRLLGVGDRVVEEEADVRRALEAYDAGDALPLRLRRGEEPLVVELRLARGPVRRAYLGLGLADDGRVAVVAEGSPAELAGVNQGERLVALDGAPLSSAADLPAALAKRLAGDVVTLRVLGQVLERDVRVELGGAAERPGYLGCATEVAGGACRITVVIAGSPAAASGLRVGDGLRRVGGRSVTGSDGVTAALRDHGAGDELLLSIERGGVGREVAVVLGERP